MVLTTGGHAFWGHLASPQLSASRRQTAGAGGRGLVAEVGGRRLEAEVGGRRLVAAASRDASDSLSSRGHLSDNCSERRFCRMEGSGGGGGCGISWAHSPSSWVRRGGKCTSVQRGIPKPRKFQILGLVNPCGLPTYIYTYQNLRH